MRVVGLVEVMKNFMEIRADQAGAVTALLLDNASPVTPGQAVVEIEVAA